MVMVNAVVICTTLCMHLSVTTMCYFYIFGARYTGLIYGRPQPPQEPLVAVLVSLLATLALMVMLSYLAVRFDVNTWQEGMAMAAALWVVDAAVNIRHFLFEHKHAELYLMQLAYNAITLGMACTLLASYGTPTHSGTCALTP